MSRGYSMENGCLGCTVQPDPVMCVPRGDASSTGLQPWAAALRRLSHQLSGLLHLGQGWEVIPISQTCACSLLFLIETGPSETPADLGVRTPVWELQLWKESPACYERPGKSMLLIQGQVWRCFLWNEDTGRCPVLQIQHLFLRTGFTTQCGIKIQQADFTSCWANCKASPNLRIIPESEPPNILQQLFLQDRVYGVGVPQRQDQCIPLTADIVSVLLGGCNGSQRLIICRGLVPSIVLLESGRTI